MGDTNPICTLKDYPKPSHKGYKNTIELPVGNNVVPLRSDTIRLVKNGCSFHGLRSEDTNQHLKDFLKLVDSLDLDGSITTWEDLTTRFLAQFFPSKRTAKHRNDILINAKESWALLEDLALYDNESWKDPRDFAKLVKAISLPQDVLSTSDRRVIDLENQVQRLMEAHLAPMQPNQVNKIAFSCEICSGPDDTQYCMENLEQAFVDYASSHTNEVREDDGDMMFIEIVKKNDDSRKEEPEAGGLEVEYFDIFPTRSELAYHKYLTKLDPNENSDRGVSNLTRKIKGMHVFLGNFTYVTDFMIIEDISSIIDLRLSQVVIGKPFIEISNMTHDPPEGVVRFTNGTDEIAYKIPHKIEHYNSLSDLEKEHTKSVYLRNEEDKKRGVEYVMNKILGFYKECLELGPEYLTRTDDEGEVT
uniref:MAK10-like protein n=1 Tax=Tanacetum cinerariifolium TaxID=118510 RepID=A0A6L2JV40_TANCI|nr:MAK10-like protein [Tanacetum cinerariifolium]